MREKYVLGVGYFFSLFGFGFIILPFGWFFLGKKYNKKVWITTGLLGFSLVILILIAIYFWLKEFSYDALNVYKIISGNTTLLFNTEDTIFTLLGIGISIAGTIFLLAQIICLWLASNFFNSILIRLAAILFIINIALSMFGISIALLIAAVIASIGFILLKEKPKVMPYPPPG